MYVHIQTRPRIVFTLAPGSERSGEYYVCQVCDRGFASLQGLATHQSSDSHRDQLNMLVQFIPVINYHYLQYAN